MKKALRFSIIAVIILVFSIVAISCGKDAKDPMTDINTTGLTYVDGVYKTTVDIDVDSFNLSACISVDEKASIFFSKSNTFPFTGISFFSCRNVKISSITCCCG